MNVLIEKIKSTLNNKRDYGYSFLGKEGYTILYGVSDDLIYALNSDCKEIKVSNNKQKIKFEDQTEILFEYSEDVWKVKILKKGSAISKIDYCEKPNEKIYSDFFCIKSVLSKGV